MSEAALEGSFAPLYPSKIRNIGVRKPPTSTHLFSKSSTYHPTGHAACCADAKNCEKLDGIGGDALVLQQGDGKEEYKIQNTGDESPEKALRLHGFSSKQTSDQTGKYVDGMNADGYLLFPETEFIEQKSESEEQEQREQKRYDQCAGQPPWNGGFHPRVSFQNRDFPYRYYSEKHGIIPIA